MKKIDISKRVVSSIWVFTLCITSLVGCGKKKADEANQDAESSLVKDGGFDKEHIFKQEDFEGILKQGERIVAMEHVGDKIKAFVTTDEDRDRCISFNSDGSDVQSFDIALDKYFHCGNATFDKDGNLYLNYYYEQYDMAPKDDSSEEASSAVSGEAADNEASNDEVSSESSQEPAGPATVSGDAGKVYIVKYDPTGKEIFKTELPEEITDEPFVSVTAMEYSDKNGLVVGTPRGIETVDEKNGLTVILDAKALGGAYDGYAEFAKDSDGKIYYIGNGESECCEIDFDKKALGEPVQGLGDSYYEFFSGEGHKLYVKSSDGVYSFEPEDGKLNKLLDYSSSNIGSGDWGTLGCAVALSETEIIADVPENFTSRLAKLSKVSPEEIADKIIVTMGVLDMGSYLKSKILDFNRSNDKYRIEVTKQYGYGDDDLNTDIISGDIPDIVMVSSTVIDFYSDLGKYVDKGIFQDLTQEFDNGGAFGDVELLPNIAEMMKVKGKFYTVIPSFAVETYTMYEKLADGKTSMSYADCDELVKKNNFEYDVAFGGMLRQEDLLTYEWMFNKNQYIDWDNKKCAFNSKEFIEFMNFVKKFPVESADMPKEGESFMNPDFKYEKGEALFRASTFCDINDYIEIKQGIFKDNITLIGYPSSDGKNLAYIYPLTFAVNAKTENREGACAFLRYLFTMKEANYNTYPTPGFSSDKKVFEAGLQRATQEYSGESELDYFYFGDKIKKKPLSQEEVDKFRDYVISIDTRYESANEISNIISEECSAFFSGQKTPEEVAEIIQNRVSVYINENS